MGSESSVFRAEVEEVQSYCCQYSRSLAWIFTVTYVFWFSESEDEVEELEERVPSPDVAPEESAPFYDPAAWYVIEARSRVSRSC